MPRKSSAAMRASTPRNSRFSIPSTIAFRTKAMMSSRRLRRSRLPHREPPLVALEKAEEVPALRGELQGLPGDPLEPARRGGFLRGGLDEQGMEIIERLENRLEIEFLLGPEVAVDGPFSHAGQRRDVIDQDLVEFLHREGARSGFQDLCPLTDGLGARRCLILFRD